MDAILATLIYLAAFGDGAVAPVHAESAKPKTSMNKKHERPASPTWAEGLPPKGSREFPAALRRRVLDGPEVSAVAVVVEFQPAAISGQGEAGLGGVTISGSKVRMIAPERFKGLEVFVHHRAVPPANSCWRVTDCNVMFAIKERMLEIRQSKEFADYATFLYDADLRDVKFTTVTVPPSRGSRTDSDKR